MARKLQKMVEPKGKRYSEGELAKLEEKINSELNGLDYNYSIEDLTQVEDYTVSPPKLMFEFEFTNESGDAIDVETRKEMKKIFDENLGKNYSFSFSTLFGLDAPHY